MKVSAPGFKKKRSFPVMVISGQNRFGEGGALLSYNIIIL